MFDKEPLVEVRLRAAEEIDAAQFTSCNIWKLQTLMDLLGTWAVVVDGDERTEFSGQFVIGQTAAYFEIIAHEPEDG